jgi:putative ABC transport system permease protein
MHTIDISYPLMLSIYALLTVPLCLCYYLKIEVTRTALIAVLRMTLQLMFVALYLKLIFRLNSVLLNFAWVLVMILIANINVVRSAGLKLQKFFTSVFVGLLIGTLPVIVFFVCIGVQPDPLYDARYLIPIAGMVLGNCLRANVISLERFYFGLRRNEKEFLSYLLMGATLKEAVVPYTQQAIRAAIAPTISTIATLGLVSLPGMMTGQILGGSEPEVAIKYQIAIMIAIFSATMITAILNLRLSLRVSFNDFQILDKSIFRAQ